MKTEHFPDFDESEDNDPLQRILEEDELDDVPSAPDESHQGLYLSAADMHSLVEERSASTKPANRLMIAGGVSVALASGFLVLLGGLGNNSTKPGPVVIAKDNSPTPPSTSSTMDPQTQSKVEETLVRGAVADQQRGKAAQGQKVPTKPAAPAVTQRQAVYPSRVVRATYTPRATPSYHSSPVSRSVPSTPRSYAQSSPAPFRPPVPSRVSPTFEASPAPRVKEDPDAAVKRLASMGVIADGGGSNASYDAPVASAVNTGYETVSMVQETPQTEPISNFVQPSAPFCAHSYGARRNHGQGEVTGRDCLELGS